jgi:AcrR family transcriptional regulator
MGATLKYVTPATWLQAERLYFEGELTLTEIAIKLDINPATIHRRAKRLKWPPHSRLYLHGAISERAVLRRIINKKLAQLEKRMEDPEAKPVDDERSARVVASLMTSVEKLDVREDTWRERIMSGPAQPASAATYGDDDVADWRQELAERIAKLIAKRTQ